MDPYDAVKEFYLTHIRNGVPMYLVDEMDIGFYFELLDYAEEKEIRKERLMVEQLL